MDAQKSHPRREKIIDIFREHNVGTRYTAEQIFELLGERGTSVTMLTTSKSLNLLTKLGVLQEYHEADGSTYFAMKPAETLQQHIICMHCAQIVKFEDLFLDEAGKKIGARHQFKVLDSQFKVYGICTICRKTHSVKSANKYY